MAKAVTRSKTNAKPAAKPGRVQAARKPSSSGKTIGRTARSGAVPAKKAVPVRKTAVSAKTKAVKKTVVTKKPAKKPVKEAVRYKCKICGYIYSPLRGEPHNGIPAGTAFEDLPDDYVCPICGMDGKGKIGKWGFEEWRPTRYLCTVCNYIYDEKRGEPHRGIRPGTKFEDLPDDYVCPVCALDPKIRVQFGKVLKQGFAPLDI